ncbi:hypothetical protein EV213_12711 [Aureibacillus halotolerans]|uniref:Uncharacterized protein n=1 Tax=Aureibacillus halotolerans TaxID=1508390 RepID=A0A4R6TX77_9BACI|nr:hypothetical protein EV213_12711 [Aureibacillus halotolerans]
MGIVIAILGILTSGLFLVFWRTSGMEDSEGEKK